MTARIIFLDDEPQTNRRLKETLETQGYVLCAPKTKEEAFEEIDRNGAELLIHCAHFTKTHWEVCDGIFGRYPKFPSLHIASGPQSEGAHRLAKGPFHHKLRPLVPEKDFLKRVKKSIFIGRLNRENAALRNTMNVYKRTDFLFDALDPVDLKSKMVKFFYEEFKAENVFFLSPGGFEYFREEVWKVSSINQPEDEIKTDLHSVISAFPCTEKQLSRLCQELHPRLPQGWEMRKGSTYVKGKGHDSYSIIPFFGPRSKMIMGFILMFNPLLYGDLGLEQAMPHLTHVLGRHLEYVTSFAHTKSLSYIDDLTELYNQRYLKMVLDKEVNRAQRTKTCFSVLFMDIDHFKRVNDTRGHITGSKVLIELSKILLDNIRASDYGFRYGGDEFLMILVGTTSDQAMLVAERIRRQVQEATFNIDGVHIQLTISIGVASYPEHASTKEKIIELADRAMYCGKNKSRNVVYVAS